MKGTGSELDLIVIEEYHLPDSTTSEKSTKAAMSITTERISESENGAGIYKVERKTSHAIFVSFLKS